MNAVEVCGIVASRAETRFLFVANAGPKLGDTESTLRDVFGAFGDGGGMGARREDAEAEAETARRTLEARQRAAAAEPAACKDRRMSPTGRR